MTTLSSKNRSYRIDIDCLRAFAMIAVVLYHCHFSAFSGGFTGVDIFFVISGYVMFRTVSNKPAFGIMEIIRFYQKRLFRIYPAILIMLLLTTIIALCVMNITDLDYYGKQLFFAAISASNILFAQGLNYFSNKSPILLHTWSLAVEMQFYVLFPLFIVLYRAVTNKSKKLGDAFIIAAFLVAFTGAEFIFGNQASFFLLQARAFEFIAGILAAQFVKEQKDKNYLPASGEYFVVTMMAVLVGCVSFFTSGAHHPGAYTLLSVLPAMAIMMIFSRYDIKWSIFGKGVAYIGRLSYGIYLFHFPVIYFFCQILSNDPWVLLLANIFVTFPLAALSYHLYETPIRQYGYRQTRSGLLIAVIIGISSIMLSGFGYLTAKMAGWPERLKYLNPYAYDISYEHDESREYFTRGFDVDTGSNTAKILFIGDSILQQYIDPISKALNIPKDEVDSVTRGGCLLLKDVDFKDSYADISCNGLRGKLYQIKKTYDYMVISQQWDSYTQTVLNAAPTDNSLGKYSYTYITPFLEKTLDFWQGKAKKIIILGVHPIVTYDSALEIGPVLSKSRYGRFLDSLNLRQGDGKQDNIRLLDEIAVKYKATIIHPVNIFCDARSNYFSCSLKTPEYSYFRDSSHITKIGQERAERYFKSNN